MSIGETPSPFRGQRPGRGLLELQVWAVPQTATIHGSPVHASQELSLRGSARRYGSAPTTHSRPLPYFR